MGSLPYEEYFPCNEELEQLENQDKALYETYRELMCHFYICLNTHSIRSRTNGLKSQAAYFFPTLDGAPEEVLIPVADEDIER